MSANYYAKLICLKVPTTHETQDKQSELNNNIAFVNVNSHTTAIYICFWIRMEVA